MSKVEGLPPINAQVEAFYNAVLPTVGPLTGPAWSLRFQLSLLFPARRAEGTNDRPRKRDTDGEPSRPAREASRLMNAAENLASDSGRLTIFA